ncbi:COP1-interacting protein-like protein [Forsythia ovata]|uniref:COP1-interacting protein-like protein n=1 Tax=Forsythia ovata TaxID=205694 RepID=A0ABD1X954_9LAMI
MFICFQDERPSAECPIRNGHEKHVQGQFPHLMFPPRAVHAPPGVPQFLQAYPVQGMPYYHTHVELVFLSATSLSNWHALLSFAADGCFLLYLGEIDKLAVARVLGDGSFAGVLSRKDDIISSSDCRCSSAQSSS